jgi:hypothetical protein
MNFIVNNHENFETHLYTVLFKKELPSLLLGCQALMSVEKYILPCWQSTFFTGYHVDSQI